MHLVFVLTDFIYLWFILPFGDPLGDFPLTLRLCSSSVSFDSFGAWLGEGSAARVFSVRVQSLKNLQNIRTRPHARLPLQGCGEYRRRLRRVIATRQRNLEILPVTLQTSLTFYDTSWYQSLL